MIREHFGNATVLTIAHRLRTIMDADRILVLDHGNVAEYDKPSVLLEREGSHLRGMVDAHGPKYAAVLRDIAFGRLGLEQALAMEQNEDVDAKEEEKEKSPKNSPDASGAASAPSGLITLPGDITAAPAGGQLPVITTSIAAATIALPPAPIPGSVPAAIAPPPVYRGIRFTE